MSYYAFRILFNYPMSCSAKSMFVTNNVKSVVEIIRSNMLSLKNRIWTSNNKLLIAYRNSEIVNKSKLINNIDSEIYFT